MERLLELAAAVGDQAEVYHIEKDGTNVSIENSELNEIETTIQAGYSLRIIKDGRLGISYTKNLLNRDELVRSALLSMEGGVSGEFGLPARSALRLFDPYVEEVTNLKGSDLYDRAAETVGYLKGRVSGQVNVHGSFGVEFVRVMNSKGLDVAQRSSFYSIFSSVLYPNSETSVWHNHVTLGPSSVPDEELDRVARLFQAGLPEVNAPAGRMKVAFLPETMFSLLWRLEAASSGRAFYERISPILERRGEKIFSDILTIVNDPTDTHRFDTRVFDDEGVPTKRLPIVERGVFKNIYTNLDFAAKLGLEPTGNGFRTQRWGGEEIALLPTPALSHLTIEPGQSSLDEIIGNLDRGVLVLGVLGPHSGNILNGDFSMGINPGLYVENGAIKGRLRDGMVAGNIYETMAKAVMVENAVRFSSGGYFPAVVFEDVSVATRG